MMINIEREKWLEKIIKELQGISDFKSILDVGCGQGYFSTLLKKYTTDLTGVDGRLENVTAAREKFPDLNFESRNVESDDFTELEKRDLLLCFGLLYHLENPFKAIRNLYSVTGKYMLIETRISPHKDPLMIMLDEFGKTEDQGLDYLAFIPSKSSLVRMLYQAGFNYVYESLILPTHSEFRRSFTNRARRTMLIASKEILELKDLELKKNIIYQIDWWRPFWYRKARAMGGRIKRMIFK